MSDVIFHATAIAGLADLPCYKLQFRDASVIVSSYGAHVLSYQPQPMQEVLWVSPKAVWQQQTPIRGGVPICWPWFGAAADDFKNGEAKLPNHGLVRTAQWQLTEQGEDENASWLKFSIVIDTLPHYTCSKPFTLNYLVRLSDQLELTLSCEEPFLQQAALHSYFAVPDSAHTTVSPLPFKWQDKVAQAELCSDSPVLQFTAEVDRIYHQTANTLTLSSMQVECQITQQGHDASVLWNPGETRCGQMADLAADSYQQFVCVESAKLALTMTPLHLQQVIKLKV